MPVQHRRDVPIRQMQRSLFQENLASFFLVHFAQPYEYILFDLGELLTYDGRDGNPSTNYAHLYTRCVLHGVERLTCGEKVFLTTFV